MLIGAFVLDTIFEYRTDFSLYSDLLLLLL